jgi:hypothetical protein
MAKDLGSGRPLLDRLGVRASARVAVLGLEDEGFLRLLGERTSDVSVGALPDGCDLIFWMAHEPADLHSLHELRPHLRDNGAIWVLRRKGPERRIADTDVIEAGKGARLVDNKIVSFSDTLAAMRLVIPLALRGGR